MKICEAVELVGKELQKPVGTWLEYSPAKIPIILFNPTDFEFINHPAPTSVRPDNLAAATSQTINDVETATIPIDLFETAEKLLPIVYHECFHVFQKTNFVFAEQFDFFKALAFYPEFDATYRALCAAETQVFNDHKFSLQRKVDLLTALAQRRFDLLSRTDDLLAFQKMGERNEGTASYVERKASAALFGQLPGLVVCQYGWSRQYTLGAAVCELLDKLGVTGWHKQVQAGISPTEILMGCAHEEAILDELHLEEKEAQEKIIAEEMAYQIHNQLDEFMQAGVIRVYLPSTKEQTYRSFSPINIVSLGDGSLLHKQFLEIYLPNGKLVVHEFAVEDYVRGEVTFRAVPLSQSGGKVQAKTETIEIDLSGAELVGDREIRLR